MMLCECYLLYVTSQQACEKFLRFSRFMDEEMEVQKGE